MIANNSFIYTIFGAFMLIKSASAIFDLPVGSSKLFLMLYFFLIDNCATCNRTQFANFTISQSIIDSNSTILPPPP